MPIEPLAELVVTVVVEGAAAVAGAGVEAGTGSRRRLWIPVWLGAIGAIVLLVVAPLPWSLLAAATVAGVALWCGVAWQRAHRRRRRARVPAPMVGVGAPPRQAEGSGPPFS
jgi:hypothetical protein